MKKHDLSNFFKSKSFYVLLSVGALAIFAIAVVGVYQSSNNDSNEYAQLEEPTSEVVDESGIKDNIKPGNDNDPPSSVTNKNSNDKMGLTKEETDDLTQSKQVEEPKTDDKLLEYDTYGDPGYVEGSTAESQKVVEAEEVMKPTTFHFNHATDNILWPVSGNVIRKYSMDSLVHYATLEQWKVSPAMLISAEVGEEVRCGADGIITSIEENEETGITLTSSLGDGYNLVYGQLQDLTVEEGDSIEKGQIIGSISEPTRYNKVEGASLYLQLSTGEDTIDPMLCLE